VDCADNPGFIELKGVQSGRCLQISGLWGVPGQSVKQLWELTSLGDNKYSLQNQHSGKCLDVENDGTANGNRLVQFDCHLGGSEQWGFIRGDNNSLGLVSVLSGMFADGFPCPQAITVVAVRSVCRAVLKEFYAAWAARKAKSTVDQPMKDAFGGRDPLKAPSSG